MSDMTFRVDLRGDREIAKALGRMNQQIHKKVLRSAIKWAMLPALNESKRMIPVESGALRDSMMRSTKALPPYVMVGKVWPKKKFSRMWRGKKRVPYFYAHLVEGGHRVVRGGTVARKGKTTIAGRHTGTVIGDVPPQLFIRDAFAITKEQQKRRFRKAFLRGAKREWRKMTDGPKVTRRLV